MILSVIAGAYDGTLHGWQGSAEKLKLAFAFKAHDTCIKALDISGRFGASAASDESIQIYDLTKMRVLDRMSGVHDDEVTALAFTEDKDGELFLISGDLKGKLYVWEMKHRRVIHELKGHKQESAVTSISVHPSGRVALSTARDNSLRMWDLVNAKPAPRIKLDDFKTLSCACWSPIDGARYAVVGDESILLVFDALSPSEKPLGVNKHPKRINAIKFIEDVALITGCDDGILRVIGADGSDIRQFKPESKCRLRDVSSATCDLDGETQLIVGGAFSDGTIKLWDLDDDEEDPMSTVNIGTSAHVTTLSMSFIPAIGSSAKHAEVRALKRAKVKA